MLDDVTPDLVRDWHSEMQARLREELAAKDAARVRREKGAAKGARKDRRPRQLTQVSVRDGFATVARAYRLLRAVYTTAVEDDLVTSNPCRIKGASSGNAAERPVLSIPEVLALAEEVPDRYEALVQLLVWSGLRIGEAAALQRRDLDLTPGYASLSVRRRALSSRPRQGQHPDDLSPDASPSSNTGSASRPLKRPRSTCTPPSTTDAASPSEWTSWLRSPALSEG